MNKLFLIVFTSAVLFSCEHRHAETGTANQESHEHEEKEAELHLDNGKKWLINDEMRPHLQASQELLETYQPEGKPDYQALATALQDNFNKLISSCTMKGPAHDQLHTWLYPNLQLVQKLQTAASPEEAGEIIENLQLSFDTFQQYFE